MSRMQFFTQAETYRRQAADRMSRAYMAQAVGDFDAYAVNVKAADQLEQYADEAESNAMEADLG